MAAEQLAACGDSDPVGIDLQDLHVFIFVRLQCCLAGHDRNQADRDALIGRCRNHGFVRFDHVAVVPCNENGDWGLGTEAFDGRQGCFGFKHNGLFGDAEVQ